MAKEVKLSDIAAIIGVSTVTVSKALSGKPGVSNALRKQIKQVADKMGYTPLSVIKGAAAKKTNNVGILIPERYFSLTNSFYWYLYQKLVISLAARSYYGILEIVDDAEEQSRTMPKMIGDQKVDGIIVIGPMDLEYIKLLGSEAGLPCCLLDSFVPLEDVDATISNGFYGMCALTNYLIRMGHRQIAFVGRIEATNSIADRFYGYRKALMENGIGFREEWLVPDRDSDGKLYSDYMLPVENPSAFVCNCDIVAARLIKQLQKKNIGVPEDISVVGFDNYTELDQKPMNITTYDVCADKMSDACVDNLLKKLNGEFYQKGICVVSGNIIYRDSVKKIL